MPDIEADVRAQLRLARFILAVLSILTVLVLGVLWVASSAGPEAFSEALEMVRFFGIVAFSMVGVTLGAYMAGRYS